MKKEIEEIVVDNENGSGLIFWVFVSFCFAIASGIYLSLL